ncbi:hypothetical protein D3C72_2266650 [compost metagenome]
MQGIEQHIGTVHLSLDLQARARGKQLPDQRGQEVMGNRRAQAEHERAINPILHQA